VDADETQIIAETVDADETQIIAETKDGDPTPGIKPRGWSKPFTPSDAIAYRRVSLMPGSILGGRYEILKTLGEGGMGSENSHLNGERTSVYFSDARNVTALERFRYFTRTARNRACEQTTIFFVCAMRNRPARLACDIRTTGENYGSPRGGQETHQIRYQDIPFDHQRR
jgi:hypothetical protein